MSQISEQQKQISDAYQLLKSDDKCIAPLASTDEYIQQAAAQAVGHGELKRSRFLLPLSVAASVMLVSGIVLKMAFFSNDVTVTNAVTVIKKQPMYMLQRSKHSAEEIMLQQIHLLIDQGESAQARSLYKKFLHRYPHYEVDNGLREKLQ